MERGGCVYILTNKRHTTLYTGSTDDLLRRMFEHREMVYPNSFTARYKLFKLVYFESFHSIVEAIERERQIKAGSREKKIKLINSLNPDWNDLFEVIQQW
jgi:putative endonuclease